MSKQDEATDLRRTAETRLRNRRATDIPAAEYTDLQRALHELQVHEIELELQNNELHAARAEREAALIRYTELYDFAPVGYLTLAADGLIEQINLTGATLLGVARGHLMKKRFGTFVVSEEQERWTRFLLSIRSHDGAEAMELQLLRGDGSTFHAQLDCVRHKVGAGDTPIGAADDDFDVSVALTDITPRKLIEARLTEALLAAEKANQAKSDFLASMSHELRTPLNAVLGFAQLMEGGTPEPTPAQKRNLEQILKGGWYLLDLINEILDLAQIESGKAVVVHEAVSLREVLAECRTLIDFKAQRRNIDMAFPQFDSPCFVSADRTRLKQILINLLFNAVKYNREGGSVVVEYGLLPLERVRISIRDTGAGLGAEQLAQLFQPFNRLGKEAGTEEGTGIGLVVTKRLVELMGGSIGVESTVGVGSVFWIDLGLATSPLLAGSAAAHAPRTPSPVLDETQHTLLYVEDNPANLELVEQLVARRPNLRLLSAADGELGIEYARAYHPAVILMDLNLPGISGIEALQVLRRDPATAHIPVIAISANAVPRDIELALAAGFFSYLTKPIKVNEFMAALDAALTLAAAAPQG